MNFVKMTCSTHVCALIGGTVLLPFPLLLLLLQLFNTLLQYIGPKVTLKVWQLLCTGQPVFCCLLEDVLKGSKMVQWVKILHSFHR